MADDLTIPPLRDTEPTAGQRVRMTLPNYAGTEVYHTLYLPPDWKAEGQYPIIVEYAGNGPCEDTRGNSCSGVVDDCTLGYGISGGVGVIWIGLPFVSEDGTQNQRQWWGDVAATVGYCKQAVAKLCALYGGDASRVFIAGFSRGSIACNFIGLHDDEIAALWRGFICHSHYDGLIDWGYARSDRAAAAERLGRLGTRPQFISHEQSVEDTRTYLAGAAPAGRFTFLALPFPDHTDRWVLRDSPERDAIRNWFTCTLDDIGSA